MDSSLCRVKTKTIKLVLNCCFSTKHAALSIKRKSKNKDWLSWNQNNVPTWSDMSNRILFLTPSPPPPSSQDQDFLHIIVSFVSWSLFATEVIRSNWYLYHYNLLFIEWKCFCFKYTEYICIIFKTVLLDCFIPLSTAVLFTGIESVNQNTLPHSNQWNMFYWSVTVDSWIFMTISENTGTCSFIFGMNLVVFSTWTLL